MSCPHHNDFDVFVSVRKADRDGKVLQNINTPLKELGVSSDNGVENANVLKYLGPTGILRASHRALGLMLLNRHWPAHDYTKMDLVPKGNIVELMTGIWPAAM